MLGAPIIGNPSMLIAYPPYWLIFAVPVTWAFSLYLGLHLVLTAWGTLFLARRVFKLSLPASVLSALVFSLAAKNTAHIGGGHIDILAAIAWLPWLWLAADTLARRPTWFSIALTAVAAAAQALSHLPTAWLCACLAGTWALYVRFTDQSTRAWRHWRSFLLAGLGAITVAMGLAAVHLWPMVELLPFSTRSTLTLSESSRYALPPLLLIGLLFPTGLAFPEWVAYAGIGPLMLIPLSWPARRHLRGWHFVVLVAILGIITSLGEATPLYGLLFHIVPGMSWMRVPTRWLFLVQMAFSLLAGMGWEALSKIQPSRWVPAIRWWLALLALQIAAVALAPVLDDILSVPIASPVFLAFIITIAALPLREVAKTRALWLTLVLFVAVEAINLRPLYLATQNVSTAIEPPPAAGYLSFQGEPIRTFSPEGSISLAQAVLHGIETVEGQDPFQLAHYVHWADAATQCSVEGYSIAVPTCVGNEVDPQAYERIEADPKLLGIGHVQYVIEPNTMSEYLVPLEEPEVSRLYRNTEILPLAFTVPQIVVEERDQEALGLLRALDPEQTAVLPRSVPGTSTYPMTSQAAKILSQTANRLELHAMGPGWLFVSEVWSPGWRAYVDGLRSPLYRTNVAFCGLPLAAGMHKVAFTYQPTGYYWGRWTSALTLLVVLGITLNSIWRRRKERESSERQTQLPRMEGRHG